MRPRHLAHTANKFNKVDYLCDHLQRVAARAAEFAAAFGASGEASLAGLLHDVGKYGELFQQRLEDPRRVRGIDHWSAGAWISLDRYKQMGIAAALAIQGHHIGLQQATGDALRSLDPKRLEKIHPLGLRLSETDLASLCDVFEHDGLRLPEPETFGKSVFPGLDLPRVASMLDVRMLFSVLVDADFIETEAHFRPDSLRKAGPVLQAERDWEDLSQYLQRLHEQSDASLSVNQLRADLLQACNEAAVKPTGLFTLTAPTGTGKTLSMLAFALKHALFHGLRRIVVVIPYLSIIEQTVSAYGKVFESSKAREYISHYILEDHSLAGTGKEDRDSETQDADMEDEGLRRRRLLAENWDAPIVVTTSVQFLESLFANKPGACRKLHRLARSVVLFDEVQTLRVDLAVPTLAALSRLAERYGATVVFSTATQPAFGHLNSAVKKYCRLGWEPSEIVPQNLLLFERAKRTFIEWPRDIDRPISWVDLAAQLSTEVQSLCIVNLKRHALALYRELKNRNSEGLFHLSTNMCPAHRRKVLEEVKTRLVEGKPCRLISTQCVEAGVDVDFPTVFRAFGPLDAIAQAAGRCNRNGKSKQGKVTVFVPEEEKFPDGAYRQAADVTRILLKQSALQALDIDTPQTFEKYYRALYDLTEPQNSNPALTVALDGLDFDKAASLYRVIAKDAVNVLVPYDLTWYEELRDEVLETGLTRVWIAKARPYTIGLFRPRDDDPIRWHLQSVCARHRTPSEDWFIYTNLDHYRDETGLTLPEPSDCLIA